jgi:hypothetical protein
VAGTLQGGGSLTLQEFRANEEMIAGMRKVFEDPILRQALVCLRDSGPASERTPFGMDTTSVIIRLGRIEGYDMFLQKLTSLSSYPVDLNVDNTEMEIE